jgi:hypothetical protein
MIENILFNAGFSDCEHTTFQLTLHKKLSLQNTIEKFSLLYDQSALNYQSSEY